MTNPTPAKARERLFYMVNGPPIPWALAEAIHQHLYLACGNEQSLERIHQRGGFDYGEIRAFAELLEKRRSRALRIPEDK